MIRPASWRTIRGITAVAAIADEMASWQASDESANPAKEVLRALRPALGTTGGPLIVISSPRAKIGPLYQTYGKHYGADGHRSILVAKAATRVMNATYPQWRIDREYEEDPENAAAEYDVAWRGDLEVFVSRETRRGGCCARRRRAGADQQVTHYLRRRRPVGRHASIR